MNWITRKLNPVNKSTIAKNRNTRKNRKISNVSQNNPTNEMPTNLNRKNSTASDPGLSNKLLEAHPNTNNTTLKKINANKVFSTENWRTNRSNTKNTTLKNIRNRLKVKNAAAIARMMNQTQKRYPVVPKVNTPKMAKPSFFQGVKNVYNAAKFRFQTRKQEKAGMNLLTANLNNPPNHNRLHPSYNDNKKNYDPNLNGINAVFTRSPSTGVAGASFVQ